MSLLHKILLSLSLLPAWGFTPLQAQESNDVAAALEATLDAGCAGSATDKAFA